jgi:hypothetical protein
MKLQEIFDQLSMGELSQFSIGGQPQGQINENNYPNVLAHINLALAVIYKRFNLKEGRLKVKLIPDQDTYVLNSKYAESNRKSKEPVKYLLDGTGEAFMDDLLKVESVQVDSGEQLPLNLRGDPLSVLTPTSTTLRVPLAIVNKAEHLADEFKTDTLLLGYRAGHPILTIPLGLFEPTRVDVQLDYSYLEALLYFIAGRINAPAGMTTEERLNNVWFGKFEAACQRLEMENLQIDRVGQNTRLERGGWV